MIPASRPPDQLPPIVPREDWSPAARRFLRAAVRAALAIDDEWLLDQAKWLEREVETLDDDD